MHQRPLYSTPIMLSLALAIVAVSGCSGPDPTTSAPGSPEPLPTTGVYAPVTGEVDTAFGLLARTANYSSLEHGPVEGAWNYPLGEAGFDAIAEAGFTAIRLPVRFSMYQSPIPPYTINEEFLKRVDWAIGEALSRGLAVIVDNQHWGVDGTGSYDAIFTDPASQKAAFESIWEQVGERYADQPVGVVFEILNEPHAALDAVWNEYQTDALAIIRESNPDRAVIVGPGSWNSAFALEAMTLPDDDNLIVTFHDYVPFNFTHQGATWVGEIPPVGVVWPDPAMRLNPAWADWSWGMDHATTPAGLEVQASEAWAGLYLHSDAGVSGATQITLTLDTTIELAVDCRTGGEGAVNQARITAVAGTPVTIDTSRCGLASPLLQDIQVLVGENASAHFTLTAATVTSPAGSLALFTTSEAETMAPLDLAASWSAEHGDVPMFLGEFGSSHLADQDSRARWTLAVRTRAEELGIAWAYFDFQGDWGAWNPNDGVTEPWLLEALLDD